MALRHLLLRLSPRFSRGWVAVAVVVVVAVVVGVYVRWTGPAPPIALLALGPEAEFRDTVRLPAEWADTATHTPDAVARFPLILGARNLGRRAVSPGRVAISVPLRYRITGPDGADLPARADGASPLVTYTLEPRFRPLEPDRLPSMLPGLDTLWLEVVIPSYYCVTVGDSIPEFVPASGHPLGSISEVRLFYSFEGGDLAERRTGTLVIGLDTTALATTPAPALPASPMRIDPRAANPDLGEMAQVGTRRSRCGEPGSPMDLLSTVWESAGGGRMITLDFGGRVRKRLYDQDGDGVIERESWAPDGDAFTATRRTRIPIPEFLLPVTPDTAPSPDSTATGPGPSGARPPADSGETPAGTRDSAGPAPARDSASHDSARAPDNLIVPDIQPVEPLHRRTPDTIPPDTGGGAEERMLPHFSTGDRDRIERDGEP